MPLGGLKLVRKLLRCVLRLLLCLVGLLGFVVGSVGLIFDPISMPVFWAGVVITLAGGVVFLVMAKMGLHEGH